MTWITSDSDAEVVTIGGSDVLDLIIRGRGDIREL